MKIRIICVGKIKEPYLRKGIDYYCNKLRKKADVEIIEVEDEKTPDHASQKEELKIKRIEGEKVLRYILPQSQIFALCIEGCQLTTEKLRRKIKLDLESGKDSFVFIIGGSLGLAPEVVNMAQNKISFSSMTFPHQMMRMILLEQLDRVLE
ncbi:MAG: 23S rRNA (pseudouridine(1915)-N(3))-methyltransferase RlmH [Lachnospiraceae bacterium]|nr:23S rRNA (pseudouridine(1915)-N(3))-methyltransferase RlmH [Lachnospiraceae bacterium]